MSVAVKAASFVMLVRVFMIALSPLHQHWTVILSAVAVLTMTVGNIAAITQNNVKRLLAYSSISHAGYILLGVIAAYNATVTGLTAIQIYLLVYTFTNFGVWTLIVAMRSRDIIGEQIYEMNGLAYKHPTLAILMLIFLLSLAGIPPTAGFIAKYYIFAGLIETQHTKLAVIAVLNAAVSVYYYLRIVVAMFMKEPTEKTKLSLSPGILVAISVALVFTLWIGFYPDPFINLARELFSS
jgi:NADH-quinone oxidoreductase subunit N